MPKKIYIIFISAIALLNFLPVFAAETYTLIVPFSGEETKIGNPADYISRLYDFALIIGGALALAVIAYHAIRYIASAGNSSKQTDAKDGILKAIIGLSLLLGATLLLNTLGVDFLELKALPGVDLKKLELTKPVAVEPEVEEAEKNYNEAQRKAGENSSIQNKIALAEAGIKLTEAEIKRLENIVIYYLNILKTDVDDDSKNKAIKTSSKRLEELDWQRKIMKEEEELLERLKLEQQQ